MPEFDHPQSASPLPRAIVAKAALAAVATLVVVFLLVFVPAGTLDYWRGWAYLALFFLYFAIGTPYFLKTAPDLIRRRFHVGPAAEEDPAQKIIMALSLPLLLPVFVVPGLDRRFGWSQVPTAVTILAILCCLAGMAIAYWATDHNRYVASTITVETGQPVISTGPYARVRHPLYSGIGLWFFMTPLALGSWWGMLPAVLVPALLAFRLVYEEHSLRQRLPGYGDYCKKVRWRLVPGVF